MLKHNSREELDQTLSHKALRDDLAAVRPDAQAVYPRLQARDGSIQKLTFKQGLRLFAWSSLTYHLIHYGIILTIAASQGLTSGIDPGGLRLLIVGFFLLPTTYFPAYLVIALGSWAAARSKLEHRNRIAIMTGALSVVVLAGVLLLLSRSSLPGPVEAALLFAVISIPSFPMAYVFSRLSHPSTEVSSVPSGSDIVPTAVKHHE